MAKNKNEYTLPEAAEALGVHVATVRSWVHETLSGAPKQLASEHVRSEHQRKAPRYYIRTDAVSALLRRGPVDY